MKKLLAILLASIMLAGICTFVEALAWNSGTGTTTMPTLMPGMVQPTWMPQTYEDFMYPFNDNRLLGKPEQNKLPAMGWNSWNCFASNINEAKIKGIADSFVRLGLDECGYQYVVIDDGCYQGTTRTSDGKLQNHQTNFPKGFKELSEYIQALGLKYGMYQNAATRTCGGQMGSWGYEDVDAASLAEWGVEYLKYDFCSNPWSGNAYRHTPYIRSITVDGTNYNAVVDGIVTGSARKVSANSQGVVAGTGGNYVDTIGAHDATYRAEVSTGEDFFGDLVFNVTVPADGTYSVGIEMRIAAAVAYPTSPNGDLGQPDTGRKHYNGYSMQVDANGTRMVNVQYTSANNTAGTGTFETRSFTMPLKAGANEIRIYTRKLWENNVMSMAAMYDGLQKAYKAAGKEPPIYSLCEWGQGYPWLGWGRKVGDCWRVSSDITNRIHRAQFNSSWNIPGIPNVRVRSSVVWEYNQNVILDEYAGLDKGWNDPDMMVIGLNNDNTPKPGYTYAQSSNTEAWAQNFFQFNFNQDKSHMSAWCMMNAPLMLGNDLRDVQVGDDVHKVITNKEVIALNQDPLGIQCKRIYNSANPDPLKFDVAINRIDVLAKPLANNDVALMFFNVSPSQISTNPETLTASVNIDRILDYIGNKMVDADGFDAADHYVVRDLWTGKESILERDGDIAYTVGKEDCVVVRLSPVVATPLPIVIDAASAPYKNGGATFVSRAVDVFIRPEAGTSYFYLIGDSKNWLDVYYSGATGNPSGSYFDGPLTSGALVVSLGGTLDFVSGIPVSGNRITVPATPGATAVLEVIAYKDNEASRVFTHSFGCAEPTNTIYQAVYDAKNYLVAAAAIGFKPTGVMDVDFAAYPLGAYNYKVFCWSDEYVPLFEAIPFK